MRRVNQFVVLGLFILLASACGGKKEHDHEQESVGSWAAMDAYHMVMAEAYHPLKDSANLAPAKAGAEALAAEAEKWATSEIPERVKNDHMTAMLEGIKTSSRAFADKVKSGAADEELAAALTSIHDDFHHIMEVWYGEEEDHH